jgi:hypothetical protein
MSETKKIYAALSKVMGDVGAVSKSRNNPQQGYKFRGIDDVAQAVQPAFIKHGVVCVPSVVDVTREMIPTKSGGQMASVRLLVDHVFYADDGSSVVCRTLGEAMDSGDKASNKAMSAALKYALLETLCIPVDEPDRDTEEHSPQLAAKPPKQGKAPLSADAMAKEKGVLLGLFETTPTDDEMKKLWVRVEAFKGAPDYGELEAAFRAGRARAQKAVKP